MVGVGTALGIWNIGVLLLLVLIGYVAYTQFPLTIIRTGKKDITYRHEFLLLFFIIFGINSLALAGGFIDFEHSRECTIVVNYSTMIKSAGTENTTYYYDESCFPHDDYIMEGSTINYARFRWFFWTYLAVYIMTMIFINIRNTTITRREE